ncbi:hypothetical protein AAZX31_17G135900 [Glycine max]|nr:hypothetical protein GLYMA_17G140651v4 [Glycine max]KAH1118405.1 hypothetical protein GYH30_047244 [Glycine max]
MLHNVTIVEAEHPARNENGGSPCGAGASPNPAPATHIETGAFASCITRFPERHRRRHCHRHRDSPLLHSAQQRRSQFFLQESPFRLLRLAPRSPVRRHSPPPPSTISAKASFSLTRKPPPTSSIAATARIPNTMSLSFSTPPASTLRLSRILYTRSTMEVSRKRNSTASPSHAISDSLSPGAATQFLIQLLK